MTDLERLDLFSTRLFDADVPFLTRLKNLKELDVRGAGLSPEAVERLRKELPGARVNH